ncbi:hypothetical protein BS78_10G209900 [Paspalum vaginatum]|nr:hypothetical protein BS78_10G209900 [Paspalum vaginatum]
MQESGGRTWEDQQRSPGVRQRRRRPPAAGFIGSWLVKKLLEKGSPLCGTPNDGRRRGCFGCWSIPGTAERLRLFDAAMRVLLRLCEESKTIIYNRQHLFFLKRNFQVVQRRRAPGVRCGGLGPGPGGGRHGPRRRPGDAGVEHAVSPVSSKELAFGLLQRLLGSELLVHVDDACDALVFCMERPQSIAGRFHCAAAYPTIHDAVDHYVDRTEVVARVVPEVDKLGELGFRYKYSLEEILDSSIACAARLRCLES